MGEVIPIDQANQRRVYPMPVEITGGTDGPAATYRPMPGPTWSTVEVLRWMLGVIRASSALDVTLRVNKHTQRYSLQIGATRRPIADLTGIRALDVLGGVLEAARQLEDPK